VLRQCSSNIHEYGEELWRLAVSGKASQAELADPGLTSIIGRVVVRHTTYRCSRQEWRWQEPASPRTDFLHGREVPDLCMRLTDPRKLDAKVPLYVGESASVLRSQSEAWKSSTTMTLMGVCVSSRRAVIFIAKRFLIGQKATIDPHTFVEEQTDDPNSASYFNGGGGFRGRLS
jgi:hypothetical protein